MKFTSGLAALSLLFCTTLMPLQAQANNYQMQQILVMNNVSTEEQTIAGQINAYVGSGQLTPAQGAAFSSELSQISSQAMMGSPEQAVIAMNELNSLSAQINGSLGIPGQYAAPYGGVPVYGAVPVYGGATPGFYNNWRAGNNAAYNEHLQAERQMQSQANHLNTQMVNQANYNNLVNRENANAAARTAGHMEAPRATAAPAANAAAAKAQYEHARTGH